MENKNNLICYTLKEEEAVKFISNTEWNEFINKFSNINKNINSVCFLNEGLTEIKVSNVTLKPGMYRVLSAPTPGGNIDLRSIVVNFDEEGILSINIQRIYDLHYRSLEVLN